jgi:hypothetical protein
LILFLQSSTQNFDHLSRLAGEFSNRGTFPVPPETTEEIILHREVRLIAFCLRRNHFHLIVQEVTDGGIAKYLQRLGNSHTKYVNIKHGTGGHLFQSRYQAVHITDNEQLLYTSAYLHKHEPRLNFPWSSYQDYVRKNRWPDLLDPSVILDQFSDGKDYETWLPSTVAKEKDLDLIETDLDE